MLKIDFFPPDIIKEYEDEIAKTVRLRNDGIDEIIFIPSKITSLKTGKPYMISITDLLTLDRKHIRKIDGIKLYMLICSAQKYKSKSNVKLLNTLNSEAPDKVIKTEKKRGSYEYQIGSVYLSTELRRR